MLSHGLRGIPYRRSALTALLNAAAFDLRFPDLGSGEVGLVPHRGGVSPTFTRATTATTVNSSGLIVSVPSGVPRSYYDPATLAYLGYLAEGARTNLCQWAEDISNAVWINEDSSESTNVIASPDGSTTADKIVEDATTAVHDVAQAVLASASTTYTVSAFFKKAERDSFIQVNASGAFGACFASFDLTNGVASGVTELVAGLSGTSASIKQYPNGWYRCTVTVTNAAGATGLEIRLGTYNSARSYAGNGTSGVYVWGAQIEAGAFASSYIPTAGSTVTRNADVLTYPTTGWYAATGGTVLAIGVPLGISGAQAMAQLSDGTGGERYNTVISSGAGQLFLVDGGVNLVATTTGNTVSAGQTAKLANAVSLNDFATVLNAGTPATDTTGTIPTVTEIQVGHNNGIGQFFGTLSRTTYYPYPRRLSNTQLQELTR